MENLAHTYGDSIYGFCLHLTGRPEYADDLYQDTFLKAIEIRHKIKLSGSEQDWLSAKNYVIGIAIRLWKKTVSKSTRQGKSIRATGHNLTMNEHYLDAPGNGYMAFSVTKKDGGKERNLAFGSRLKASYTDTQKNTTKEFASYEIIPVYSEQQDSLDGIRLSFYGTLFPTNGGEIVIQMGKETFTFSDIKVTQPHYYEWKSPEGSVFLSSVGMIAEGNTKVCNDISDTIGTEKDTEGIATLVYKDGHQDPLQLSHFCGVEDNNSTSAVIQFSPWTKLSTTYTPKNPNTTNHSLC